MHKEKEIESLNQEGLDVSNMTPEELEMVTGGAIRPEFACGSGFTCPGTFSCQGTFTATGS